MRQRLSLLLTLIILLLVSRPVVGQDAAAWEVLDLVNQERNHSGIHSLTMNQSLVVAAQRHSNDMAATDTLTHTGSDGSEFWVRMSDAGYVLTTGAENVLMRWDTSGAGAYDQWLNSPPHRTNYMNAAYVEIGIAYAQAASGAYYFTMVLGARAGVEASAIVESTPLPPPTATFVPPTQTPISVLPSATSIPPTSIPTIAPPTAIPTVTQIPATPIPTVAVPTAISDLPTPFSTQILPTEVAALPQPTNQPPTLSLATVTPIQSLPTSAQEIQTTSSMLGFRAVWSWFWSIEFTQVEAPQIVQPTLIPTEAQAVVSNDLRLLYDQNGLTLINISGEIVNIRGLRFESDSGVMDAARWETEFLSQSLGGFTPNDCLQVWMVNTTSTPPMPSECLTRHAWIAVGEEFDFWRNTPTFNVLRDGRLIAICDVAAGVCDVDLSGEQLSVIPTSAPNTNLPQADLRFFYDANSFSLVNVSGRPLDLSGLFFRGETGAMEIGRWETEFLSQPLTNFSANDCLQVWQNTVRDILPQPDICVVRHGWVAIPPDSQFWLNTQTFSISRGNDIIGVCNALNGVCDITLSSRVGTIANESANVPQTNSIDTSQRIGPNDVRLAYSPTSFALINTSGRDLDLSRLAFESDSGVMVASRWNVESLSRPLSAFPSGDCLQLWQAGTEFQAIPNGCNYRHAWIAVSVDQIFWVNTNSFRVRRDAELLTTCSISAGACDFALP